MRLLIKTLALGPFVLALILVLIVLVVLFWLATGIHAAIDCAGEYTMNTVEDLVTAMWGKL